MNHAARTDLRFRTKTGPVSALEDLDIDNLRIGNGAQAVFNEHHRASDTTGRDGILDTIEALLDDGAYRIDDQGAHILFGHGYRVVISADQAMVLSYATLHKQRTLAEVLAGKPSASKRSPVRLAGLLERLDDDGLDDVDVSWPVLREHLGPSLNQDSFATESAMVIDALAEALDLIEESIEEGHATRTDTRVGSIYALVGGKHVLCALDRIIVLRNDGLRVTAVRNGTDVSQYADASAHAPQDGVRAKRRRKRNRSGGKTPVPVPE